MGSGCSRTWGFVCVACSPQRDWACGWLQRHGLNASVPRLPVTLRAVAVSGSRACSSLHPAPSLRIWLPCLAVFGLSLSSRVLPQLVSGCRNRLSVSVFQAGAWSPRVQGWGQGETGTGVERREGQDRPGISVSPMCL